MIQGFQRYKTQVKKAKAGEVFAVQISVLRAKTALGRVSAIAKTSFQNAKRTAMRKWELGKQGKGGKGRGEKGPETEQRLFVLTGENNDLKVKLAKLKSKLATSGHPPESSLQDLMEENRKLKEKLQVTEQNVGVFIKEMANLLDQHEPPGLRQDEELDLVPRPPSKNKKLVRPKIRSRVTTYSPERIEEKSGTRRSIDKRRLQFD